MTAIKQIIAVGLSSILCLSGCGPDPAKFYVGKWVGTRAINKSADSNSGILYTASRLELTIKPDGTFEMVDGGMPKTGTIDFGSTESSLSITAVMGSPMDRQPEDVQRLNVPIKLTRESGGTIHYFDPNGFDKSGLTLKKQG